MAKQVLQFREEQKLPVEVNPPAFFQKSILGEEEEPVSVSQIILTFVTLTMNMENHVNHVFTVLASFGSSS